MKTATCRECKGVGTITVDNPAYISQAVTMTCYVCRGTKFVGMNKEQVKWYQTSYKTLELLRSKSLRAGSVVDPTAYMKLKAVINKACAIVGVTMRSVERPKAVRFGETTDELFMKAEMDEYRRRLYAIPVMMANKSAAMAA